MTLMEILKANNVPDDAANAILESMKANKIFTASEENLDIRYGKLKTDFDGLTAQHKEATTLISQLKAASKGQEDLQGKINTYESQVADLQAQLAAAKLEAAIKVGLLAEDVQDVDYLTFKLKEKGELKLDDSGKVEGWDDKIAALKTQFPQQFGNSTGTGKGAYNGYSPMDGKKDQPDGGLTKEAILKMPYPQRAKLYTENPTGYKAAMEG